MIRDADLKAHYDEVARAEHEQVKGAWGLFRYFLPFFRSPSSTFFRSPSSSEQDSDFTADVDELEASGTDYFPAGTKLKTNLRIYLLIKYMYHSLVFY